MNVDNKLSANNHDQEKRKKAKAVFLLSVANIVIILVLGIIGVFAYNKVATEAKSTKTATEVYQQLENKWNLESVSLGPNYTASNLKDVNLRPTTVEDSLEYQGTYDQKPVRFLAGFDSQGRPDVIQVLDGPPEFLEDFDVQSSMR